MDDEELRAELRGLIAKEVAAQFSHYRGIVSAHLSTLAAELDDDVKKLNAKLRAEAEAIIGSRSVKFAEQLARAQDLIGGWGRAVLFGAFLLAGVGAAAWIGIAWTEQQFRWQVAKSAEIEEQIAAQERTLDQLNRGSGGLTLTEKDSEGHCFALFPADADVTTFWRVRNRPAIEVECDE